MRQFFPFLFCFFLLACGNREADPSSKNIEPEQQEPQFHLLIKDGDLVLRADDDLIGLSLRNMNDSDKTYSHSGLLFKEADKRYVYHMMAGEENPSKYMIRDSLENLIDHEKKSCFGIYRYQLKDSQTTHLHQLVQEQYAARLMFDTAFDLKDHSTMYCTEMIACDLAEISDQQIQIPTTHKDRFVFKATASGRKRKQNLTYIAIDNLYLNEHCRFILSKRYHP
jgi:hypothetical protein